MEKSITISFIDGATHVLPVIEESMLLDFDGYTTFGFLCNLTDLKPIENYFSSKLKIGTLVWFRVLKIDRICVNGFRWKPIKGPIVHIIRSENSELASIEFDLELL